MFFLLFGILFKKDRDKTEKKNRETKKEEKLERKKKVRLELFEYTFSYSNEYTRTVGV